MANSIFSAGGESVTPSVARMGKAVITIAGADDRLICNSAGWQFGRNIQTLHPLNSNKKILIPGEPVGRLTLSFIVGPSRGVGAFLKTYGNTCDLKTGNTIVLTPADLECGDGMTKTTMAFSGILLESIAGELRRTEMGNLVIPQVSLMFLDMTYND